MSKGVRLLNLKELKYYINMEFKGKFYKGDYICYLNRNNVNFINKQMDCFTKNI